ncbi:ester cyclase [Chloroflexota bacterium]
MSEANKAISDHMAEEVWSQGNLDAVDELCAPDVVLHGALPGMPSGREGIKAIVSMYRDAFPDFKVTNEFVMAEGDMVASRWSTSATHKGELMGIPATGNQVSTTGISISRIVEGKIVEVWSESDQMDLMQQLGVAPR